MNSGNQHPASAQAYKSQKVLRRTINLAFMDLIRMKARTLFVSPFGLTMMSPLQIAKGKICEIAFDIPLDGEVRKVNAVSTTCECVCVGTEGFRTRLDFIQIDTTSSRVIHDLMQYPY